MFSWGFVGGCCNPVSPGSDLLLSTGVTWANCLKYLDS